MINNIYKRKRKERVCKNCNIKFISFGYQKYCSKECNPSTTEKVCPICNKSFFENRIYCSNDCKIKYLRSLTKLCITCNKKMNGRGNRKYCSKECVPNIILSPRLPNRICKNCNKNFYRGSNNIYCSKECREKYNIKSKKIFKTTNLQNKKSILNTEETIEFEEIVEELKDLIENVQYKCIRCNDTYNITETWKYEDRKYKLEKVRLFNINNTDMDCRHHIIPRKYGINNDETNLIFLCKECHDHVEIKTEEYIQSGKHYDIDILKSLIINDGFEDYNL
jgi:hypothetical protein